MERRKDYEPMMFDLQKSRAIRQPKAYFIIFIMSVVMFGILVIFAAFYFRDPTPRNSQGSPMKEPTSTAVTVTPTAIPVTPTPIPSATAIPAPQNGWLTLHSSPEQAEVVINGNVLGKTPLKAYALSPGTYPVRFSYNGQMSEQMLTIVTGETTEFTYRFPGFGSLKIETTSSGSDILLNGKPAGKSPLLVEGLAAGTYVISAKKTGYGTSEKTVKIAKGQHREVFMTIKRLGTDSRAFPEKTPTPTRPLHPSERLQRRTPTP